MHECRRWWYQRVHCCSHFYLLPSTSLSPPFHPMNTGYGTPSCINWVRFSSNSHWLLISWSDISDFSQLNWSIHLFSIGSDISIIIIMEFCVAANVELDFSMLSLASAWLGLLCRIYGVLVERGGGGERETKGKKSEREKEGFRLQINTECA